MQVGYWVANGQAEALGQRLALWADGAGWSGYLFRANVNCYSGFKQSVFESSPSAAAMLREYYSQGLTGRDPIHREFARRSAPIAWEFDDLLDGDDEALGMLNEGHGFGSGIELPLLGSPGVNGILIVLSAQRIWSQRMLDLALKDAFFMAAGFAAEVHCHVVTTRVPKLTARERECLCLTAAGKTSIEIGMILDITPRTVDFHIGNCVTKLGCSSRRHAVSSAIGLGLISQAAQ